MARTQDKFADEDEDDRLDPFAAWVRAFAALDFLLCFAGPGIAFAFAIAFYQRKNDTLNW